jgi:4-amino-4-deoxy-L-arabinose transferase-like glycosyltransferase
MTVNERLRARRSTVVFVTLLIIFLVGMGLRLYALGADSLWLDEILTALVAREDVLSILRFHAREAANPPLISLIIHAFFSVWGENEFVARLPSALVGSLSILLVYEAGALLWTRRVGLLGALLLAVNPYHVAYSQEARHYALMAFLALLSLIFLLKALKGRSPWLWLGFVLCTSLSLYNHYFAFLFLPAEVLLAAWTIAEDRPARQRNSSSRPGWYREFWTDPTKRQAATLLLSLLCVGILYLPWVSALSSQFSKQLRSAPLGLSATTLESALHAAYEVFVDFGGVEGPLWILWLALFLLGLASAGWKRRTFVLVWLGATLAFLLTIDAEHPFRSRYVIFSLPIYLLVIANGLTILAGAGQRLLSRLGRPGPQWRPALISSLAALLLAVLSLPSLAGYYQQEKEDWRDAAAYILDHRAPGEMVIADGETYGAGGDSQRTSKALSYYFLKAGEEIAVLCAQQSLATNLGELPGTITGAWGVLWHGSDLTGVGDVAREAEVTEFPQVAVVRPLDRGTDVVGQAMSVLSTLDAIQPSPKGRIDLQLAMAAFRLQAGDLAGAKAHVAAAREAAEALNWAIAQADALVKVGTMYRDLREPTEALDAYRAALEVDPQSVPARFRLGETYLELADIPRALEAYEETLVLDPSHPAALKRVEWFGGPADQEIANPLVRSVGMKLAFLGYGLSTEAGGDTMTLTSWWQPLTRMDADYTAFVHLIAPDGQVVAQEDQVLEIDELPTSKWTPGETVSQEYKLDLPEGISPAGYVVKVGVYYWATGERLPVWNTDGLRIPGDTIQLQIGQGGE